VVVEVARAVLADLRARIAGDSNWGGVVLHPGSVEELITATVERMLSRSLQPVINATGVISIQTWAARRCRKQSWKNFRRTATQYSNLEYDLEAGARGKRDVHTAELLTRLTARNPPSSSTIVPRPSCWYSRHLPAAAEVIVSRGELIEIGDGLSHPGNHGAERRAFARSWDNESYPARGLRKRDQ